MFLRHILIGLGLLTLILQDGDCTDKIEELAKYYPQYRLVILRIQDAFDPIWWQRVTSQNLNALPYASESKLSAQSMTLVIE